MKFIKYILNLIRYAVAIPTEIIISIIGIAVGVYKHPAYLQIKDDEFCQRRDAQPVYQGLEL